jgi:hypothetical protein
MRRAFASIGPKFGCGGSCVTPAGKKKESNHVSDDLDVRIQSADPFIDAVGIGVEPSESLWRAINERRGHRQIGALKTRVFALSGTVVALGISLALLMGTLSESGPLSTSTAAATQLRAIGAVAGVPQTIPGGNLWLHRSFAFSLQSSPPSGATLGGTVDTWANGTMGCQAATFQPVTFGTASAAATWQGAGLSLSPVVPGAQGYCGSTVSPGEHGLNPPAGPSDGITPIDVTGLTNDPTSLAHELETGTTGIPSLDQLDQLGSQGGPLVPFDLAVLLLVAPLTGAQPGLLSSLYQALALLPGVSALRTVATHTGTSGEGFAASNSPDAGAIVVDPHSGQLLEIRNLQFGAWHVLWAMLVMSSFTASGSTSEILQSPLVDQLYFSSNWIDPVGTSSNVDGSSIPHLRTQTYL